MNNVNIGDKVVCINNKYENGEKCRHLVVGETYTVDGVQLGTVRVAGFPLFYATWHFKNLQGV